MAPVPKKGPILNKNKKTDYYVKDRTLIKPPDSSKSLRDKALQDKVFYFDFKNASTAAWLEKEIRKLGGRVEYFFGKDVHYIITDKPQTRQSHIPPCSPFSNGPSPHFSRPDTSQSMRDIGPSPSDWAYSEQYKKPGQGQASSQRSRGGKMMELASNNKSQGSCDILSSAKERGIVIRTVEQITFWLNTVHKKLGTKLSSEILKETPKNPSRKLRGDFVKIQDKSRKYKPQVLESSQWQTIDCNLLTDESPFNTEKRRLTRKQANELHKPESGKKSIKSILKKEVKKKPAHDKGFIRRKGGGKCEGCNMRFENLETHLTSEQHTKYAKKEKHFETIDSLVADGLSLDNFLKEHELRASYSRSLANSQNLVLSPQVFSQESSTEPLDVADAGPCTRARKHKYFCQQPNVPSEQVAPHNCTDQMPAPSPKMGVPELENNYYLRSTPRKLVGMLEDWDSPDNIGIPGQVGERTLLHELQCQSLEHYSSQAALTTHGDIQFTEICTERVGTVPCGSNHVTTVNNHVTTPSDETLPSNISNRLNSPTKNSPFTPVSRSRNNSAKISTVSPATPKTKSINSPSKSKNNSPTKNTRSTSPAKRSPRLVYSYKDTPLVKRRITNHS